MIPITHHIMTLIASITILQEASKTNGSLSAVIKLQEINPCYDQND